MNGPLRVALVLTAIAAGLALLGARVERLAGGLTRQDDPAVAAPALTPARLVDLGEESTAVEAHGAAPARTDASVEPTSPSVEGHAVPADIAVAGVVVDARGRPLPGARVWHEHLVRARSLGDSAADLGAASPFGARAVTRVTTADRSGAFLFEGTRTADGGELYATEPTYLDEVVRAPVDPTVAIQVLRFPAAEGVGVTWKVEVVDSAGVPVPVDDAQVTFVRRTRPGVLRAPRRDDVSIERGLVTVRHLAPAVWQLDVDVPHSLGGTQVLTLDPSDGGDAVMSLLSVEVAANAQLTRAVVEPAHDGNPWLDDSAGLARWIPAPRVGLGAPAGDRYFATTLRPEPGEVTAAELVLDLRAHQSMSANDTLSLEFTLEGGFVWQRSIATLVAVPWEQGAAARLRLDLTRLPLAGGGTLDLRPRLADGLLDVVVEDDTTVEGLELRLLR